MMVLVKTDNHVEGNAGRSAEVEALIRDALSRFAERITRVEVKFFDDNSREKAGQDDLRCVIEVMPAGLQPIIVSCESGSLDGAAEGAIEKMQKTLGRTFDRLDDRKGRTSYGGDQVI